MTHTEKTKNAYKILLGKPQGKKSLGRHKVSYKECTKTNFGKRGCEGANWIKLAPIGSNGWVCEHGDEISGYIEAWNFLAS
jgi:hypothetical protein